MKVKLKNFKRRFSIGNLPEQALQPLRAGHLERKRSLLFPDGGIEAVVIYGVICANDICNWEIKSQESVAKCFLTSLYKV